MDRSADISLAVSVGTFAGALLLAFLISRFGLHLRRSTRYEPSTLAGVHVISFFILGTVACSNRELSGSPGLTTLFAQLTMFAIDYFRLPDPEDYVDDEPQKPGAIKPRGILTIAAIALIGIALAHSWTGPDSDEEIVADFEAGMKSNEANATYLDALKRNFPDEYQAMIADMLARAREADRNPARQKEVYARFRQDLTSRLQSITDRHQGAMSQAPAPALNAFARAMKAFILEAQGKAVRVCAVYALGARKPFAVPAELELANARLSAAMFDLARAGLDRPSKRDLSAPPRRELEQVLVRVKALLEPSLRETVDDSRKLALRPIQDRCAVAVAYYRAIAEMPAEESAALTAYDLSPVP